MTATRLLAALFALALLCGQSWLPPSSAPPAGPGSATLWNGANCLADLRLRPDRLTVFGAQLAGGGAEYCAGTLSHAAGKFGFTAKLIGTNLPFLGGDAAIGITTGPPFWQRMTFGPITGIQITGVSSGCTAPAWPASNEGNTVSVEVDLTAQLFWVAVNGGPWSGGAGANPETGAGGCSFSSVPGPWFPFASVDASTGNAWTANFGALAFVPGLTAIFRGGW